MYRILTCSSDTYITDKIIGNSFRAVDANVGHAGTIDLFKLSGESRITGSDSPIEISRGLLKFDLEPLRSMTSSCLDVGSPTFKCFLHLSDVYGGQTTPTNFSLVVYPLSRSFDEGFGRDVGQFQDLDAANFLTSSCSTGISLWASPGASAAGFLGSPDVDVVSSGVLSGIGQVDLGVTQVFRTGEEDLVVDVTRIVSGTLVGLIPDCGFRVSYSGSHETDGRTLFVKRFASRHSTNPRVRPRLRVTFDDTIIDDHESFTFDLAGSLFLRNLHRGSQANILSGASGSPVSGLNCLLVTLTSGSFSSSFTGSQHKVGQVFVPGVYSATFSLSSENSLLRHEIRSAGSATFNEIWSSLDRTVGYLTRSLVVKLPSRTALDTSPRRLNLNVFNVKPEHSRSEKVRFRIFAQSIEPSDDFRSSKVPLEARSEILRESYYRIRDANSNDIVVPFERLNSGTRLSTDSVGMFFDFYMDTLDAGRVYEIDLLVIDSGVETIYAGSSGRFRVVN